MRQFYGSLSFPTTNTLSASRLIDNTKNVHDKDNSIGGPLPVFQQSVTLYRSGWDSIWELAFGVLRELDLFRNLFSIYQIAL